MGFMDAFILLHIVVSFLFLMLDDTFDLSSLEYIFILSVIPKIGTTVRSKHVLMGTMFTLAPFSYTAECVSP